MSDFFDSMIARATTEAAVLRPRIAPRFAPSAHESLLPPEEERAEMTHAPDASSPLPERRPPESRSVKMERSPQPAPPSREAAMTHSTTAATNDARVSHPASPVRGRIETSVIEPQPLSVIQPRSIPSDPPRESSAPMPTATHDARESSRAEPDHREWESPPRATLTPRRAIEPATTRRIERIETRVHESQITKIIKRDDAPETTHASPAPTIQVTIGRIEVRAETPPPRRTEPAAPRLTLDDYLRQRGGER